MSTANEPSMPVEALTDTRKPWSTPEIRDQSVKSLTQGKAGSNPTEASPMTGPS